MEYKFLGKSAVKVTPLAFGAWAVGGWMWGGAEENAAIRAIRASYDLGMTTIDTAPVYGFGISEELVGKALSGISRDKYQILTKFGLNWETEQGEYFFDTKDNSGKPVKIYRYAGREKIIQELEASLRRLKTDYIDLLQIHWSDATTPIAETMETLAHLITDGKIRAAGVCNYNSKQVDEALQSVQLVSNQVPYSMVNRGIEIEIVPQAISKGMSIIPYSPLQRGLLTGKIKRNHQFNEGDTREGNKFYTPENIDRTNALLQNHIKPIADAHHASIAQVVLNWTTRQPAMDCVLAGARDENQVKDNVKALDFTLTDEELTRINSALSKLELIS
ncbi:MAG TPA: aldo/keto reductase [Ohtaekwangia sp.]|nr:aldo/keto reductase [Ohtaekwangia sp.]